MECPHIIKQNISENIEVDCIIDCCELTGRICELIPSSFCPRWEEIKKEREDGSN